METAPLAGQCRRDRSCCRRLSRGMRVSSVASKGRAKPGYPRTVAAICLSAIFEQQTVAKAKDLGRAPGESIGARTRAGARSRRADEQIAGVIRIAPSAVIPKSRPHFYQREEGSRGVSFWQFATA